MARSLLLSFVLALVCATAAHAGDWPQIRGPERDGIGREAGLFPSWSETQPRTLWRKTLGSSFSGMAVVEDALYTMASEDGKEIVLRLDASNGTEQWRTTVGELFVNDFGNGSRTTPTVDGETVYTVSGTGSLYALATDDGRVRWHVDLIERFGGQTPRFGYSPSPLVDGDQLILEVGSNREGQAVASFDKRDGSVRWSALDGGAGYSSPVVSTLAGVRQMIFIRRQGPEALGMDFDGTVLWRHPGARASIPMPVPVPPNHVFLSSSDDDFGGVMVELAPGPDGKGIVASEAWNERLMRNHMNASVLVDGHLYGFDNATLKCLDAETGTRRWAKRGFGKGSVIANGDRLFVLGDDGTLALVEATPEAYREHGRSKPMDGRAWTSPSLAHGRLFLRDLDEIVALEVGSQTNDAATGATP